MRGRDPERNISVPGCVGAIGGDPKSSRTAKIQSKVLTDHKNSIQSLHGLQKNNPKSSRTAQNSIQSPHGPQQINPKFGTCFDFYSTLSDHPWIIRGPSGDHPVTFSRLFVRLFLTIQGSSGDHLGTIRELFSDFFFDLF